MIIARLLWDGDVVLYTLLRTACVRSVETTTGCLFQLHIAAANGYIQVTEFLLSRGVTVDVLDSDSWQPIHCAACWGQVSWFHSNNNKSAQSNLGTGPRRGSCARRWLA